MYSVTRMRRQSDLGECYIEQMGSVISIKLVLSNGSRVMTKIIVTMHLSHFLMLCCWTENDNSIKIYFQPLIIRQIFQFFKLFIKFLYLILETIPMVAQHTEEIRFLLIRHKILHQVERVQSEKVFLQFWLEWFQS